MSLRDKAITEYHQLLAAEAGLSAGIFKEFAGGHARHAAGLWRPANRRGVAPAYSRGKQFELLAKRAELVASALEKVAAAAVEYPTVMDEIGLTPLEQKLALIHPGFSGSAITSRMDGFVHGEQIKFVEYNAENPSSLSDQEGLNRLLSELPEMSAFRATPSAAAVFASGKTSRARSRPIGNGVATDVPRVAIIDWQDLPTANEFVLLRDHFENQVCARSSVHPMVLSTRAGNYGAAILPST